MAGAVSVCTEGMSSRKTLYSFWGQVPCFAPGLASRSSAVPRSVSPAQALCAAESWLQTHSRFLGQDRSWEFNLLQDFVQQGMDRIPGIGLALELFSVCPDFSVNQIDSACACQHIQKKHRNDSSPSCLIQAHRLYLTLCRAVPILSLLRREALNPTFLLRVSVNLIISLVRESNFSPAEF